MLGPALIGLLLAWAPTPVQRCAAPRVPMLRAPTPRAPSCAATAGPSELDLARGVAFDTLRSDYGALFTEAPDLSIFSQDITVHDPSGKRLHGLVQYERLFAALRFVRSAAMQDAELTYRLHLVDEQIHVRWSAKLFMHHIALPGLENDAPVQLDGVSVYDFDARGLIRSHRLENILLCGRQQPAASPLGFAWDEILPGAVSPPPPLVLDFSAAAAEWAPDAAPREAQTAIAPPPLSGPKVAWVGAAEPRQRRALAPLASVTAAASDGGETPMERARREREEDAAKARRLDLEARRLSSERKRSEAKAKGGIFGAPWAQPCESSSDCESPQVCCDLLVTSVCCSGGMMIPALGGLDPALQPRPIPVPVDPDDPLPFPPGFPGDPR